MSTLNNNHSIARESTGSLLVPLGWALLLLTLLAGLMACGRPAPPPTDPYAQYRPALKDDFQYDFDHMAMAPRYAISLTIGSGLDVMTATGTIQVVNDSGDNWRYLLFRLYPTLDHYGGSIAIQSVAVNDQPTPFTYQDDNTSLRIDLVDSIASGDEARVQLNWKVTIPQWPNNSATYALFGRSQEMVSLPLFYPSLAVYGTDAELGLGAWWTEQGTVRGDAAYNVMSLFTVTATLPSNQVVVATGTQVDTTSPSADQITYTWVTGPVREFMLHMSPLFESAETEAFGTRVVSYWLPGQEASGRAVLQYAAAALRIYSDYYGEYPYQEMHVAPGPINFRGMEYPQVILLGTELYSRFQADLEVLTAHEMAHQWWYLAVHNDPVTYPWLDEALAEYSVRLYYRYLYGPDDAALLIRQRWQTPLDVLIDREQDAPINQPVDAFANGSQYETVVYGKGALFYTQLQEILGERRFRRFMRDYYQTYRYQTVDVATWQAALSEFQLPAVDALVREWIGVVPTTINPAPAATETVGPDADDNALSDQLAGDNP